MAITPEEESELQNILVAVSKAEETYTELALAHVAMPGLNAVSKLMIKAIFHSSPILESFNVMTGDYLSEALRQGFSEVFLAGMEYGKARRTLMRVPGECDDPNCPGNHVRRN